MTCRVRSLLVGVLVSTVFLVNAFSQGAKVKSQYDPIEESDRDDPGARQQWYMQGRIAPKGKSAAALRLHAVQQKMAMRGQRAALVHATPNGTPTSSGWVGLGPAPLASGFFGSVSGRVTAVAIDPSDTTGNTVYVGGAYGGVWKTTNGAAAPGTVSWTPVTDQQASLATGSISVKSDGSVVLVGTGETNNSGDSYYGVGILRSTDKGQTWTLISSGDSGAHPFAGLGVSKFAWIPGTNTVVAAVEYTAMGNYEGDQTGSSTPGLYLSSDGGQTWAYQAPADGSGSSNVTDVIFDASANSGAGAFFAAIQFHGVYTSANGTNWTRLTNQPNPTVLTLTACPTTYTPSCPMYRGQLAVVPGRNEMYFWFVNSTSASVDENDEGIWRSTDGGNTWAQIDHTGIASCGDSGGCGTYQGWYDLEIAAIPDGTATDLYAGAVNLFKCKLASGATTCSTLDTNLANSWINLTHVYNCSTIAGVHPDEHSMDIALVSGSAIMYFGNDGGVYRALNGYTGLNSGSCGVANAFDDLNGTIGSMTQYVSFSIHPTDINTVLGGTQDNGSPASTAATTATPAWFTANAGDGGYNAINPSKTTEWFTANTRVSIQACETAPSCSYTSFSSVVTSSTLSGDSGPFYTPYILDPQNTSEMLVGTCRVWRGSTAGTAFSMLSPNVSGNTGACTGGEYNAIFSLAAGGPKDTSGFSNVVYATTSGGNVYATTNAATTQMADVTGGIDPSGYPISSVSIDTSDATGQTAYVSVMGFNTSHVFKTVAAGNAWTDWTGTGATALPDSPVDVVLVDSSAALVYAGTDVGVFVSSTSSPSWTEVGPAPAPGVTGYLPNVEVTTLRMFFSGGVKKLRAGTHGRGIWDYDLTSTIQPDFSLNVTATPAGAVATQNVSWSGTISALNGYSNTVTLSCSVGAPATCSVSPASIVPAAAGTPITVTLGSATAGSFTFSIQGTDGTTSHTTSSATLTVVTGLSVPATLSTTHTTVNPGQTALTSMTVTPVGGSAFSGNVTYACSGLPAGMSCVFNPTQIASGGAAASVGISIATAGPFTGTGSANPRRLANNRSLWLPLGMPLIAFVVIGFAGRRLPRRHTIVAIMMVVLLAVVLTACGNKNSTSSGVSVAVSPSTVTTLYPSLNGAPAQTAQFTATVSGSSNTAVTWAVTGGNANGTISTTGLYTAPASMPSGPVSVTATSQADTTKSGSATVTLQTPTAAGTYPVTVTVTQATQPQVTQTATFSVTVQ